MFTHPYKHPYIHPTYPPNPVLSFLKGFYKRTDEYVPIRNWERTGCHAVPMIHSTMLIDLRRRTSRALGFYPPHRMYPWVLDDILTFSFSARQAGETCTQ